MNALGGSTAPSVSAGEVGVKRRGGDARVCACRMLERNHVQLSLSLVGCGQRIVWVLTPGDPRYFTHVGRVVVIGEDGHARQSKFSLFAADLDVGEMTDIARR